MIQRTFLVAIETNKEIHYETVKAGKYYVHVGIITFYVDNTHEEVVLSVGVANLLYIKELK